MWQRRKGDKGMKGITERKKVEWWCGRQIANHTQSCFPTGLTHNPSLHSSKKDWSEMVLKCPCPQMVHVIMHTSPVLQNGRWRVCDCELHWLLSSRLGMVCDIEEIIQGLEIWQPRGPMKLQRPDVLDWNLGTNPEIYYARN